MTLDGNIQSYSRAYTALALGRSFWYLAAPGIFKWSDDNLQTCSVVGLLDNVRVNPMFCPPLFRLAGIPDISSSSLG